MRVGVMLKVDEGGVMLKVDEGGGDVEESSANKFLTQTDTSKTVSPGGTVTISATGSSDIGSYL
ncbi:hypothetical protein JOQ06_029254, partial [Pogonophryne albipinna]